MHSFTANYDTFSNEEQVAVVVQVISVEVACSEAMLALSLSTLLVNYVICLWLQPQITKRFFGCRVYQKSPVQVYRHCIFNKQITT